MAEHPLKKILSRALALNQKSWRIVYLHRGAPDDKMEIPLSSVSKIGKGSFTLNDDETQIPFHRILTIISENGLDVLWEKRLPKRSGQDP